jgi:two-component sensor histidine kinase
MSLIARVVLLIALALLPGFTVQLYTEYRLRQAREQEVLDTALRLASQAGATYGRLVDGARQLVTTLALLPAIQPGHEDECNRLLADLQQQFPDFDRIGVVDDLGRLRCGSDPGEKRSDASEPYFRRAAANNEFSIGLRSAPSGIPDLLQFGYPVYAAQHFAGIVFAEISLRALANYLRAGQPLPSGAALALFDVTGTVLMRLPDDPSYVGVKISADDSARMNAMPVGTLTARGVDGRMRIFGHVPLQLSPGERLTLGVGVDRATAFAEYRKASRSALLLIGIGAAVALIVAWGLARWFLLAPIRRLLAAAERWGGGDYTYRVTLRDQRNELGRLGCSLNHMAGTCQDLLRRKDLLFKEINHRIFNSLQVLSSAISLQRSRLASPEARENSDRIRQRVISTGLILRRIYAADQLEEVPLARFLTDLSGDMSRVLLPPHLKDRLKITAADVVVPIDWIVPLASVVVEVAMTIGLRLRADSDHRLIDMTLEANPDMTLRLVVSGTGEFSEEIHPDDGSLRAEIVRLLLDQLGGSLETQRGTDWIRFTMHLPRPPRAQKRPDL